MKIKSSAVTAYAIMILLVILAFVFQGCSDDEGEDTGAPPTHQAVAVIPEPTQAIQAVSSPTTAILQTSPSPGPTASPTDFGQVVSVTVAEQAVKTNAKHIDLVFCLDVSGSMGSLIEAAKKKLMDIARDIKNLKQHPTLRIALLSYGSGRYRSEDGWVRIETDFTEDLDQVYQKLAALRSGGSIEFVGRVVATSLDRLSWSATPGTLRVIFVAGNESVKQDASYQIDAVSRHAKEKKVIVNTIYCAEPFTRYEKEWQELALLCDGKSSTISLTGKVPRTPVVFPSGFPTAFPSGSPAVFPSGFPTVLPTTAASPSIRPSAIAPRQSPGSKTGLDSFEGQIVGILNGNDLMVKSGYGGLTRTFRLESKTRYTPGSWRPASGENVIVRYSSSQPDSIKEIERLN